MSLSYRLLSLSKSLLRGPRDVAQDLSRQSLLAAEKLRRLLYKSDRSCAPLDPPEQQFETSEDWFKLHGRDAGANYVQTHAARSIPNKLPRCIYAQVRTQLANDADQRYEPNFVLDMPNGRVWGEGMIVTPDNCFLKDVSVDHHAVGQSNPTIIRRWDLRRIERLKGTAVVIATDGAALYYHWLFQALPRFELLELANISLNDVDHIIINKLKSGFQTESLDNLGIDRDKVIEVDAKSHLEAERLIVPSIALGGGNFPPWMVNMLRKTFLKKCGTRGNRRIYIGRGSAKYRRVLNEADIVEFLKLRGFETVLMEQLTVVEQAELMSECSAIVAPHGGGLSNLVFCSPDTKVVEIFSPELVAGYYWKLSNQLSLDYYYLLGEGPDAAMEHDYDQSWDARADIRVDLQDLEKTLDLAGL